MLLSITACASLLAVLTAKRIVTVNPTKTGLVLVPAASAADSAAACSRYGLALANIDDANYTDATELLFNTHGAMSRAYIGSLYGEVLGDGRPLALHVATSLPGGAVASPSDGPVSLPVMCTTRGATPGHVATKPAAGDKKTEDEWRVPRHVDAFKVFSAGRFVLVNVPTSYERAERFCAFYGMRMALPSTPADASLLATLADSGNASAWVGKAAPSAPCTTSIVAARGRRGSAVAYTPAAGTTRASVVCQLPSDGDVSLSAAPHTESGKRLPPLSASALKECTAKGTRYVVLPNVLARAGESAARVCAAYGLETPAEHVAAESYYALAEAVRTCGAGEAWAPLSAPAQSSAALVVAKTNVPPTIALLTPWETRAMDDNAFICERTDLPQ